MVRAMITGLIFYAATAVAAAEEPVTMRDILFMNHQVEAARVYFDAVWHEFFRNAGGVYRTPKVSPYVGSVNSACGKLGRRNAYFCEGDNTIYYDQEFLAGAMKFVGSALHTDGDYAAIVILAHEWGHAADYWYRQKNNSRHWTPLAAEQTADCLAGAVTLSAEKAGRLDRGDLLEAERSIQTAGDIDYSKFLPEIPGKRETVHDILHDGVVKAMGHGDPEQRLKAFRGGYRGGTASCLSQQR